ncbi:hypothetical protein V498_00728 [Pseudogymnoascus sp. VKM F-4517 (FW-2822)]|nr:hypothetical protein V498_00728 [Pseudogymnoascus sp. VKM F-4517 (FW-2822)]
MTIHKASQIHLLDGGLGTTLVDFYSCVFDERTPLWSSQLLVSSPSTLQDVQTAFARAGADILLTATYQASLEGFSRCDIHKPEAIRYMRSAVTIARAAFEGRSGRLALSLGAYGATMIPGQEYSGRYGDCARAEWLREWHLQRVRLFYDGVDAPVTESCWEEIDFLAFETLPLLSEVSAVRETMGAVATEVWECKKEFWISCVFPGEGNVLPDGSSVEQVVRAMLGKKEGAASPSGVGINCTPLGKVEGLIVEFEKAVEGMVDASEVDEWPDLVIYPDATNGEVYNTSTKQWENGKKGSDSVCLNLAYDYIPGKLTVPKTLWDEALFDIVNRARDRELWRSIIVGGCCKSTPAHIAKLRNRIEGIVHET